MKTRQNKTSCPEIISRSCEKILRDNLNIFIIKILRDERKFPKVRTKKLRLAKNLFKAKLLGVNFYAIWGTLLRFNNNSHYFYFFFLKNYLLTGGTEKKANESSV